MGMNCRRIRQAAAAGIVGLVMTTAAGCSDEDRDDLQDDAADLLDDAAETAVRNFARMQAEEQFNNEGFEIDSEGFTCTAEVGEGGLDSVDVECTGTTVDGGEAVLRGTTAEIPGASITELKGTFTATVDGEEIFATDQLGG